MKTASEANGCSYPCTKVVRLLENQTVRANTGFSAAPYTEIDGFRFIHLYVQFPQEAFDEPPVDVGVSFAFDEGGTMHTRRYVNLEENLPAPQSIHFIEVSGSGSWGGQESSYIVRLPVMGPFIEVYVYNRAPIDRAVNVWAYLVA
jgi:hypothetical protein